MKKANLLTVALLFASFSLLTACTPSMKAAKSDASGAVCGMAQGSVHQDIKSCDSGCASACYQVAVRYASGRDVKKDANKANAYYVKACKQDETLCSLVPTRSFQEHTIQSGKL